MSSPGGCTLPFAVADAMSWRLAVEIVRRAPGRLWICRTLEMNDMYDLLNVVSRAQAGSLNPRLAINRSGEHATIPAVRGPSSAGSSDVIVWTDYLAAPDRRDFVADLGRRLDLGELVGSLPPSTASSLALRWIAQMLALQLGSRQPWTAQTAATLPEASDLADFADAREWLANQANETSPHGMWFVGPADHRARYAINWDGDLWSSAGRHWSLLSERRRSESITSLISRTASNDLP